LKTPEKLTSEQKANLQTYIWNKSEQTKYLGMKKNEAEKFRESFQVDQEIKRICGDFVEDKYIKDTILGNYGKSKREITEENVKEAIDSASRDDFIVNIINQEIVEIRSKKDDLLVVLGIGTVDTWGSAVGRLESYLSIKIEKGLILSCKEIDQDKTKLDTITQSIAHLGLKAVIVHPLHRKIKFPILESKDSSEFSLTNFQKYVAELGYEFK